MTASTERIETVVIGGGQAGLAVGHHLAKQGRSFLILDEQRRGSATTGAVTTTRCGSTAPRASQGCRGWRSRRRRGASRRRTRWPTTSRSTPSAFELPVRSGTRVDRISRNGERYAVDCGDRRLEAENVVVATGTFGRPFTPEFAIRPRPADHAAPLERVQEPRAAPGRPGPRRRRRALGRRRRDGRRRLRTGRSSAAATPVSSRSTSRDAGRASSAGACCRYWRAGC